MRLNWEQLICHWRCPTPGKEPSPSAAEEFRSPFEADNDRIVYAAAFRRLARKTQVHPFSPNDHVHNRLTHSIEVASVGRSLTKRLIAFLRDRFEFPQDRTPEDLCQIVQAACLVHDIGNPPFGHAGEFAIRAWVQRHRDQLLPDWEQPETRPLYNDLAIFEGNAQGFRLAARADNPQTGYMRLTYATLGAMIKYPWDASDPRAAEQQKFNVFSTERDLFGHMVDQMGLRLPDGTAARHPLSFLSEAADDICYRILDLEDAVDLGIIPEDTVRELLLRILKTDTDTRSISLLRGQVIRVLIDACWDVFAADYEAIMAGERTDDLKAGLDGHLAEALRDVKHLYNTIFAERGKVATELGAYETLGRIIDMLAQATQTLAKKRDYNATDFLTRRRLELAWGEAYARENEQQSYAWWLHQVADCVSGFTDNYARQLSREIAGV